MRLLGLAAGLLAVACGASLPDAGAPGAVVLQQRCAGCHGLSAPGSMTLAMWEVQLTRMHDEFARRGLPWLTADEERALREYLAAHAGTS